MVVSVGQKVSQEGPPQASGWEVWPTGLLLCETLRKILAKQNGPQEALGGP
ncbi:MAG TPA: hypothetical protein VEQ09_07605 [Aquabacterium sp.]|nr:hypothetical protein [Aquabacterium sp.]